MDRGVDSRHIAAIVVMKHKTGSGHPLELVGLGSLVSGDADYFRELPAGLHNPEQ